MLFSLLKHHLDLNITDTALKVSRSLYCFNTSILHGVENYFPRLWGTGISDAIFFFCIFVHVVVLVSNNNMYIDIKPYFCFCIDRY